MPGKELAMDEVKFLREQVVNINLKLDPLIEATAKLNAILPHLATKEDLARKIINHSDRCKNDARWAKLILALGVIASSVYAISEFWS